MYKAVFCALAIVALSARVRCQDVIGVDVTVQKQYEDASLVCMAKSKMTACTWSYYDLVMKAGDQYAINISPDGTNCTLVVKLATAKNFGTYNCSVTLAEGSAPLKGVAQLYAKAIVDNLGQSLSVTEGNQAQLTCKPIGNPKPNVTWTKEDINTGAVSSVNNTHDPRFSYLNVGDIQNAILVIDNVQVSDRAIYICTAANRLGSGNNTLLLRVKSKLAPLYPAIGIIIELIVLALIIIIYELYKKKKSAAEKGEDEKELTTNSHDKTKSS